MLFFRHSVNALLPSVRNILTVRAGGMLTSLLPAAIALVLAALNPPPVAAQSGTPPKKMCIDVRGTNTLEFSGVDPTIIRSATPNSGFAVHVLTNQFKTASSPALRYSGVGSQGGKPGEAFAGVITMSGLVMDGSGRATNAAPGGLKTITTKPAQLTGEPGLVLSGRVVTGFKVHGRLAAGHHKSATVPRLQFSGTGKLPGRPGEAYVGVITMPALTMEGGGASTRAGGSRTITSNAVRLAGEPGLRLAARISTGFRVHGRPAAGQVKSATTPRLGFTGSQKQKGRPGEAFNGVVTMPGLVMDGTGRNTANAANGLRTVKTDPARLFGDPGLKLTSSPPLGFMVHGRPAAGQVKSATTPALQYTGAGKQRGKPGERFGGDITVPGLVMDGFGRNATPTARRSAELGPALLIGEKPIILEAGPGFGFTVAAKFDRTLCVAVTTDQPLAFTGVIEKLCVDVKSAVALNFTGTTPKKPKPRRKNKSLPRNVSVALIRVRPLDNTGVNPFDFEDVEDAVRLAQTPIVRNPSPTTSPITPAISAVTPVTTPPPPPTPPVATPLTIATPLFTGIEGAIGINLAGTELRVREAAVPGGFEAIAFSFADGLPANGVVDFTNSSAGLIPGFMGIVPAPTGGVFSLPENIVHRVVGRRNSDGTHFVFTFSAREVGFTLEITILSAHNCGANFADCP